MQCGVPTLRKTSLLDAIQNRAARWVLKSRWDPVSLKWTRSSVDCISALNWPSLSTRRTYFVIMFLYSVLYGYLLLCVVVPLVSSIVFVCCSYLFVFFLLLYVCFN